MDRIFFGDNQFFGVNHMSEEKARQQLMRFQDIDAIMQVLHYAHSAGVHGFMCTTHERMIEVTEIVKREPEKWAGFSFYPGMPYAHKYANAMTELGPFEALKQFLPSGGLIDAMMRGSKALFTQDVESVATLLVDAEMKAFEGLNTPIIFLQNVVTDLILGLGYYDAFRIFADHVKKKYGAEPGFFTMNLPMLLPALDKVGVKNPIVCANVNKIAFRMSGGIDAYRRATDEWPARVIAMSVLASGAIPAREAIEWVVNEPYVESILFGASSRGNIESTVSLIREADAKRAAVAA
ncbi:hypothetical protein [Phenylobacterium kunshanense]|uniref:Uroporphyrinogen decarboxylase (URO-D) domain-containing protein n=1 Tax=Phenylobacterium kunshanense TaxID=1445034 RepID=A0A328BKM8_9CAUL|nr:hypothetical protein [Phenylobacterium kunshanense]RAK66494.1 hypothetical protein DJ019_09645 [Phenylobacterium kunshanense]